MCYVLEPDRERERAVAVGAALAVEFLGPEDVREGEPHATPDDRRANLEVAHKQLLVDVVAVGEGIAVEEDVARHCAAPDSGEEIPG